jgi:hypothetical protein
MEEDQKRLDDLHWAERQAAQLLDGGLSAPGGEVNAMSAGEARPSATTVVIEVRAGVVPGQCDPALQRRFELGRAEWERMQSGDTSAWDRVHGEMLLYILRLMSAAEATHSSAAPGRLRWVSVDWRWDGE